MKRTVAIVLAVLFGLAGLAAVAVLVFTSTDFGRERVRRFAVGRLAGMAHGIVRIGKIEGNLASGVKLIDVSITDSSGAPLLAADTIAAGYRIRDFIDKKIFLHDVKLVRPTVVLSKLADGDWNYERIFPGDTTPSPKSAPGFGDWIRFSEVAVIEGRLMVRTPWKPSDTLAAAARDSAITVALGGGERTRIERVAGGFQKIMEFRQITGQFPRIRIADPELEGILAEVATARMIAEMFSPPAADVRDLAGTFHVVDDSVYWRDARAQLSASRVSKLSGTYYLDPGDLWVRLHGDTVALTDVRWLYPRLPSDGGGTLDFYALIAEDSSQYIARNASVRTGSTTIAGDFGLSVGDSVRFHDTNLRFTSLGTALVEQLVPGLELPRRGTLSGRTALSGTPTSLRVDANLAFDDTRSGLSSLTAVGEIGFSGEGFRARSLRVHASPVQVDLGKLILPELPIAGTISGRATMTGGGDRWLFTDANAVHRENGAESHVIGLAEVNLGGIGALRLDVRTMPVSLVTVGRFFPNLGLRGQASGTISIRGPFNRLVVDADLAFPDGGSADISGTVDIASEEAGYDITAQMSAFNAAAIMDGMPKTSLTGTASADGRGFEPATMRAAFVADLNDSRFDTLSVDSARARIAVADGVARVDTLVLRTASASADASGTIGMVAPHEGTLVYRAEIDSLSAFSELLPGSSDTVRVEPRPARRARMLAKARADSTVVARATEVEREVTGSPSPALKIDSIAPIRRDSLAGWVYTAGTISGSFSQFNLRGRAAVRDLAVFGNTVQRGQLEYSLTNWGTSTAGLALGGGLKGVQAGGFAIDSADVRIAYQDPDGRLELAIRQADDQEYVAKANFELHLEHNELHIEDLRLRFDTTVWASAHPGTVRWGRRGIELEDVEMRSGDSGRVYVDGLLPTEGVLDLQVEIQGFQIANLVDLLQTDIEAKGVFALNAKLEGTRSAPRFAGTAGVAEINYRGTEFPDVRATFQYADAELVAHAEVVKEGRSTPLLTADGKLPVNLAFTGIEGDRFRDAALTLDIVADSLPLEVLPRFTDVVSDIEGRAIGKIAVRGTLSRPVLAGAVALDLGSMRVVQSGMRLRDITGALHIVGDTLVIDSLIGRTPGRHGGAVQMAGTLDLAKLSEPGFDLDIIVNDARILENDLGTIDANADLTVSGPFDAVYINGSAEIIHGVIYIPKPDSKTAVKPGDPAVFAVVDTSVLANRALLPAQSPLLENLRIDMDLHISRGTFARSAEGNIEIFTPEDVGPLSISVDRAKSSLTLEGMVSAERGMYSVAGREFEI
ncbi:MAG: translocation/assembly module TamB domain-containing protein, partial [Anaerolineae bacterium]|nr:translocation/assembly module TamB domain-containing protein [Gemmatimonadaceae bacterium]